MTTDVPSQWALDTIALTRSCFSEKFAVPRQPQQTQHAWAELIIQPPFDREEAFRSIEGCSHLWLTFIFHENEPGWRPTVRPPRLGGNRKVGVFATRSPFRPNRLGLSVVTNRGIERKNGELILKIQGHDLVQGTPIVDIKPYLPWVDSVPDARFEWSTSAPSPELPVTFSENAETALRGLSADQYPDFRSLIVDLLSADPRPGYRQGGSEDRIYGVKLYDRDVQFRFDNAGVTVTSIQADST